MPEINDKQLREQIENLAPLYFLYGDEKYLLKKSFRRIEKIAEKAFSPQFNYSVFSDDSSVDDIANNAFALPFMADRKYIIVKDFNVETKNAVEISKLEELISDVPESTCLVFALNTLNIDIKKSAKWRKFIKIINEKGYCLNFPNLEEFELVKYVTKICEKSCTISKKNATLITEYVGSDMTALKNECEKLISFANGREITHDDIERLVTKNADTTVFILIKSIIANDSKKAYELLKILFNSGQEAVPILAMIAETYIDLYRVKVALECGKTAKAPAEYAEYKGREFRLTNAARDVRNIGKEKLRECLNLILDTDFKLKDSRAKGQVIIEELIAKLLVINKGGR